MAAAASKAYITPLDEPVETDAGTAVQVMAWYERTIRQWAAAGYDKAGYPVSSAAYDTTREQAERGAFAILANEGIA